MSWDRIAYYLDFQYQQDAINKATSYRTRKSKKAAVKAAYLAHLERAPSKAAGRRQLGCLSDWYDGLEPGLEDNFRRRPSFNK